jgi:hypothetical protein
VAIFGANKRPLHAGEFLYKKSVLIARGSYRPPTLVQQDMIDGAYAQFLEEPDVEADKAWFLSEITLDNLQSDGPLDERDFLDRADLLCALGHTVVLSNCMQHKKLIAYFSDYKVQRIGLAMGARKLQNIIGETCAHNPDNLLTAFGEMFLRNVRFYIYPAQPKDSDTLLTAKNIDIPPAIHFLYDYLLENGNIVDVRRFDPGVLQIFHGEVLRMIQQNKPGWESCCPAAVVALIKEGHFFGYGKSV